MNEKMFVRSVVCGLKREVFGPSVRSMASFANSAVGETCFVLGNGPSLSAVDNEILGAYPTFGTNGIFLKHVPDYYVTISVDFYKGHIEAIRRLRDCVKFIGDNLTSLHTNSDNEHIISCGWNIYGRCAGINFPVPLRFSRNADRLVYLGGSVLFVCLQLAYWMGYKRVILLGVDHHFGFPRSEAVYGGRRIKIDNEDAIHFNKRYFDPGSTPHFDMLATERAFMLALKVFQGAGREIWNATQGTSLDIIPKRDLKDLLDENC